MKSLMISCKMATQLADKKLVFGLTLKESMQLKIHGFMCKVCAAYARHSVKLESLLMKRFSNLEDKKLNVLPNEKLKKKILTELNHSNDSNP